MSTTNAALDYIAQLEAVPAGYELNLESVEPSWDGPQFEGQSFASWSPDGFRIMAIAEGEGFIQGMSLERAKAIHCQLQGILGLMGELTAS